MNELPERIERLCCPRKGTQHGTTTLVLVRGDAVNYADPYCGTRSIGTWVAYVRESNGDPYFHATSIDAMRHLLDDLYYITGEKHRDD